MIEELYYLELQGARFCSIPYGEKGPRTKDWHLQLNLHRHIDIKNTNIGILLGHSSDGIIAIDFDGSSAGEFWLKTFPNVEVPNTVGFTSTRPSRFQLLFKVPIEYIQHLSLKQIKTGVIGDDGKNEQIELRSGYDKGVQSVLPPSVVIDSKGTRQYQWLKGSSPTDTPIANLPEEILVYWLSLCNDLNEKVAPPRVMPVTEALSLHLAETLKAGYPSLDYDNWIRVAWAFKNECGYSTALDIMRYYWPEDEQGEYSKLLRSEPKGKRATFGSIRYMIKKRGLLAANKESEINLTNLLNQSH